MKASRGFIVYVILVAAFIVLAAGFVIRDEILWHREQANRLAFSDKADIFRFVRENRDVILADAVSDDFTHTVELLHANGGQRQADQWDGCARFECFGAGWATGSEEQGFLYVPWDGPVNIQYIIEGLPSASMRGEDLIPYLEPEGDGWAWYQSNALGYGDNEFHTEKICDNLWYYRLVY